ncbi:hypothetical protein RRG08_046500 [Elysia crispata]|uniref:Uncharacterized protein n=1 Tax=Elysia crispata TaxID=231223 RepID=A0AAE0YIT2_9GAST|nr:hypothetical protein RRG08_046500 [Elysia crispata]
MLTVLRQSKISKTKGHRSDTEFYINAGSDTENKFRRAGLQKSLRQSSAVRCCSSVCLDQWLGSCSLGQVRSLKTFSRPNPSAGPCRAVAPPSRPES